MKITSDISDTLIVENLKLTGVEHLIQSDLKNLSGGEFQRVLIARAIANSDEKKSANLFFGLLVSVGIAISADH